MWARAAAAAARPVTTSRGTRTNSPRTSISISSSAMRLLSGVSGPRILTRAECIHLRPADHVDPPPVRHDRSECAVWIRPQLLPGAGVEPVRAPVQGREVDDAVYDGRRAGDRAVCVELPEDGSGRRVQGVERVVVRADVDPPLPDRG